MQVAPRFSKATYGSDIFSPYSTRGEKLPQQIEDTIMCVKVKYSQTAQIKSIL